jgi:hypothetical protein
MSKALQSYRQELKESKSASQDQLDKALLTLSAGAFGITFAYIDNFITGSPEYINLLFLSWICWGLTIGMSLIAFYLTIKSFKVTIKLIDQDPERVYEQPFNKWDRAVNVLNILSLGGFLIGLLLIGIFVKINL